MPKPGGCQGWAAGIYNPLQYASALATVRDGVGGQIGLAQAQQQEEIGQGSQGVAHYVNQGIGLYNQAAGWYDENIAPSVDYYEFDRFGDPMGAEFRQSKNKDFYTAKINTPWVSTEMSLGGVANLDFGSGNIRFGMKDGQYDSIKGKANQFELSLSPGPYGPEPTATYRLPNFKAENPMPFVDSVQSSNKYELSWGVDPEHFVSHQVGSTGKTELAVKTSGGSLSLEGIANTKVSFHGGPTLATAVVAEAIGGGALAWEGGAAFLAGGGGGGVTAVLKEVGKQLLNPASPVVP